MKALKFLTAALVFAATFSSCKKDDVKPTSSNSSIEGKWSGFKGYDNEAPDNDILWNIKSGGKIEETNTNGLVKGSGTWSISGSVFTAHYQFKAPLNTVYSFKGTYDKNSGKITGTWGFDDSDTDAGNWYSNKIQ